MMRSLGESLSGGAIIRQWAADSHQHFESGLSSPVRRRWRLDQLPHLLRLRGRPWKCGFGGWRLKQMLARSLRSNNGPFRVDPSTVENAYTDSVWNRSTPEVRPSLQPLEAGVGCRSRRKGRQVASRVLR
jgi:hypothetical protein